MLNETHDLAQQPHDEVTVTIAERSGETDEHHVLLFDIFASHSRGLT